MKKSRCFIPELDRKRMLSEFAALMAEFGLEPKRAAKETGYVTGQRHTDSGEYRLMTAAGWANCRMNLDSSGLGSIFFCFDDSDRAALLPRTSASHYSGWYCGKENTHFNKSECRAGLDQFAFKLRLWSPRRPTPEEQAKEDQRIREFHEDLARFGGEDRTRRAA